MIALNNRALLKISGSEAEGFLQNLITTDMDKVVMGGCHAGALLTPQGKIQFEFLVSGSDDHFLIETSAHAVDALHKRLMMYRLRLPIEIQKLEDMCVYAVQESMKMALRDHRFQSAIYRLYDKQREGNAAPWLQRAVIDEGVAQAGVDFELNDVFPHDINFDQIGGMSFSKGCYVGQEVISRMHHKSNVRKRLMVITAEQTLDDGIKTLTVDDKPIGTTGSVSEHKALAICRIDKASNAIAEGKPIMLGDQIVTLEKPLGAEFTFPIMSDTE